MKILQRNDCTAWCLKIGLQYKHHSLCSSRLAYACSVAIPEKYTRTIALVDGLLATCDPQVHQGLVWVVDNGIWSETATSELFSRAIQLPSVLDYSQSGYFFETGEYDSFYLSTLLVCLGKWDALIVPAHGQWFLSVSHDGFVDMASVSIESVDASVRYLEAAKFELKPIDPGRFSQK